MDRFDDPKIYRQKRESFTRSLQHFHEARGTPFRKIPVFCGKEVDLFRLYNVVTQRGGWVKVNRTNQWKDILPEFNIPKGCVNGGNALKQIYLRYLDRYEKVHYLGESSDRHDLEEEEVETGRHRPRWSSRSVHSVPLTYNHHQHNIIENLRKYSGLSSDIYKASDYDRLALSLVSPLPNEQDFAINVCTLLSNEGKHTLKLEKCPKIIDFLLAHAGVYNHSNLRILFEEVYGKIRGHSLTTFWSDVLETTELLDLTDENNFTKHFPKSFTFYKTSSRTNDVFEKSASDTIETNKNSFYKKCETRTVVHSNLPVSESKENSTTRMPDSSEKSINSIQDSLNAGKQSARDGSGENNLNKTESTKNDIANRNDEKTIVNSETLNLNSLNGLGVEKAFECDSVSENLPETSTSVDNEISIKNVEFSTTKEPENLPKNDTFANDIETSAETSESKISLSKECTNFVSDETECSGKSDSQILDQKEISNEELNPSLEPMEIEKEEHETGGNKELETQCESKVEDQGDATQTGFSETKVAEKEESEEKQFKTPEDVILTEEARLKEQERLRKEKERLEAEELARKEAENLQRIEEEKQRAAEEAAKLEKQLKEAEMYEAMLREEEKKKKVYYFDEEEEEAPLKKPKKPNRCMLKIEPEDLELFCLGRENGTHDYIGQRVLQVAHILRNLTFCEESMPVMAKNTTFLRFLLLCINSKWSSLNQLGLDMLGNISPELTIEDPSIDRLSQTFFWTVHRGIQHSNRFFIISCLEILNKICQKDENEDVVCKNLDQSVYDQVCRLLSLHDIMILLYTLECLYSMSSMGEKACTYICRSKGAIEMLLALITVEAQSYGPKACILMRVIETVSGTAASNPPPVVQPPAAPSPNPIAQMTGTLVQSCSPQTVPSVATASTMTVQQGAVPKIVTPTIVRASSPKTIVGMPMAAVATPVQLNTSPIPNVVPTLTSVQQQHAHQQTVQENEQFALAWLRATFELSAGGKVEQQEVYRRYVDSCSKMGRKGVITAVHFPRFVRSVFGGTVGPKSMPIPPAELKPNGPTAQSYYEGIKVRDVPLTINIKIVPVTEVPRPVTKKRPQITTPKAKSKRKKPDSPTSPILKAQLISPNKPPPSPSPSPSIAVLDGKTQVSTQTPGQLMLGQSSSPPCTPPPMDNSTLIKSLLASKVSEICMTAPLGMLSDNTQVVQRQQQNQKILQQQLQGKAESPKTKVIRLNGIIQDPVGAISENHLAAAAAKGKKEPPQPPPLVAAGGTAANALRPKTPKMDEDSDSMASTSRDCTAAGGGNVSSADDNDNSLTSFEGIFNGIPETLDFDATVSSIVKENCANNSESKSVVSDQNTKLKSSSEENKGTQIGIKTTSDDSKAEEKTMTDESSVKQTQNKSLMLADLLDKKEGPALNGVLGKDLRIGEKGLELVEKAILKETHLNNKGISVKKDSVVNVNGETRTGVEHSTVINNAIPAPGSKRPAANEKSVEETQEKRRKLSSETSEGNEKEKPETKESKEVKEKEEEDEEVNGEEEVKASSTAASLFAALAAETLKDETEDEVPSDPQPQAVVVPGGQIRPLYLTESSPILVTASGNRQIIMTPSQLSQQGQVLISAGGQSLPVIVQNQRIVQGVSGQMLVASQPQQYIMSGNSQNQMLIAQPQTALVQGQPQTVLVAQAPQQPGTKTIIILQPQSQGTTSPQQGKMVVTSQGTPMVVTTSVPRQVVQPTSTPPLATPTPTSVVPTSTSSRETTTDVVLNSGVQNNPPVSSLNQNGSQIQIISSGVQNNAPILNQNSKDKNKTQNSTSKTTTPTKLTDGSVFLCEWRGCMRSFKTANEVYMHVCNTHCPANAEVETQCLWERCDGMKRKRFSLMTHLFDRHCNADALNMMAVRRKQLSTQGRTEIPAPTPPPPHPGYAPNAAFHAIKRHALEFVNPKELLKANGAKSPPPPAPPPPSAVLLAKVASPPVQVKDDNEGPVTKSIRLTASLILRNLVIYSSVGRRFLKGYEPHLASIALSNVESSRTIAQVLADLNDSSSR